MIAPHAPLRRRATGLRAAGPRAADRAAFTLLELLVVMVIIAILSSMVLAGLYSANEAAKHAKTKATIAKIHGQLAQHWASYETRRLPISIMPGESPQAFEARRLLALWMLQRVELPDSYEDIQFSPALFHPSLGALDNNALQMVYRAHAPSPFTENVSARCLYLIITLGMNDNDEVRFLDSEVGDTDQDGRPDVFVDAWGRPIRFIRWAPGYVPRLTTDFLRADTDFQRDDPPGSAPPLSFQADPFDRRGLCREGTSAPASFQFPPPGGNYSLRPPPGNTTNRYGFKLMPLVVSAGPDGELGIFGIQPGDYDVSVSWHPYAWHYSQPRGTPIVGLEGGGHADNITNHRLGTR